MENNNLSGAEKIMYDVCVKQTEEMLAEKHQRDVERWHEHLVDFADQLLADKRYLEALILSFYKELEKADCSAHGDVGIDGKYIQPYYAEYFGIKIGRNGE